MACERAELERCELLGISASVAHPGAHLATEGARKPKDPNDLDSEPTAEELAGLKRIAKSIDQLHKDLKGYKVCWCWRWRRCDGCGKYPETGFGSR